MNSPLLSSFHLSQPPSSGVLPYTTLFRSTHAGFPWVSHLASLFLRASLLSRPPRSASLAGRGRASDADRGGRSEEHTSELQSRQYLVCRLLPENKNQVIDAQIKVKTVLDP